MKKVIVAGTRTFNNRDYLFDKCDQVLRWWPSPEIEIVSGRASGADKLGEEYAEARDMSLKKFPADWSAHGKAAGPIRNGEMAEYANILIVFWDRQSSGTKSMIHKAIAQKLDVHIFTNW